MDCLEQRPQALMILDAGRALHARRNVDAERTNLRNRFRDVVRRHKRQQARGDRPGPVGVDEPRALRPEPESDRARARLDGGLGVFQARDAANLYEHPARSNADSPRWTPRTPRWLSLICDPPL